MTMKINDTGVIGVEAVEEHEDGSATYQFHFDNDVKTSLAEYGLKLVLYCAAAKLDMQIVFDFIEDHMRYENDELTEYEFGTTGETQKCVSCGNTSATDFCEFCLKEE
jgi:hypothetical protein